MLKHITALNFKKPVGATDDIENHKKKCFPVKYSVF